MAFLYTKTCKVCKLIRRQGGEGKSDLMKRIYNSREYDATGESLRAIWQDYEEHFGYLSVLNHAKKHQAPTTQQLADKRINDLATQLEDAKLKKTFSHHEVRGMMRDLAGEQIESGQMKISGAVAASILKQELEIEEKQKDREFEVFKMLAAFQSGAIQREEIDGPITAERNLATGSAGRLNEGV